ncbi:hypothetical protein Q7P36_000450 [Cladosporium allicinum]
MFTSLNGVDVAKDRAWFAGLEDAFIRRCWSDQTIEFSLNTARPTRKLLQTSCFEKLEALRLKIGGRVSPTTRAGGLGLCAKTLRSQESFDNTRKVNRVSTPYSKAVKLACALFPARPALSHPVEKRRRSLGDEARALPHATALYIPAVQKQDPPLLSDVVCSPAVLNRSTKDKRQDPQKEKAQRSLSNLERICTRPHFVCSAIVPFSVRSKLQLQPTSALAFTAPHDDPRTGQSRRSRARHMSLHAQTSDLSTTSHNLRAFAKHTTQPASLNTHPLCEGAVTPITTA